MRRSSRRKRSTCESLTKGSFDKTIVIEESPTCTPVRKRRKKKNPIQPASSPIVVIDLCDVTSEEEEESVKVIPQPRTRRAKRKRKKILLDNALRRNTCVKTAFGEGFVRNVRAPEYEGWEADDEFELMYEVELSWCVIYCSSSNVWNLSGQVVRFFVPGQYTCDGKSMKAELQYAGLVRLEPTFYVNDSVIDIYLRYVTKVQFTEAMMNSTHLYNSYFYTKMFITRPKLTKEMRKQGITLTQRGYEQVRNWTRNVDIFEKDFLIIPINDRNHWSVAIIVNPGLIVQGRESRFRRHAREIIEESKTSRNGDKKKLAKQRERKKIMSRTRNQRRHQVDGTEVKEKIGDDILDVKIAIDVARHASLAAERAVALITQIPAIICFDSLRVHKTSVVAQRMRKYLQCEFNNRHGCIEDMKFDSVFIPSVVPSVPKQENSCDCGIFILSYVEHFFRVFSDARNMTTQNLIEKLSPSVHENWFTLGDIGRKRKEIRNIFDKFR